MVLPDPEVDWLMRSGNLIRYLVANTKISRYASQYPKNWSVVTSLIPYLVYYLVVFAIRPTRHHDVEANEILAVETRCASNTRCQKNLETLPRGNHARRARVENRRTTCSIIPFTQQSFRRHLQRHKRGESSRLNRACG
jgi:hypothetical protein